MHKNYAMWPSHVFHRSCSEHWTGRNLNFYFLADIDRMKLSCTSGATEVDSDPAVYNDTVLRWAGLPVLETT